MDGDKAARVLYLADVLARIVNGQPNSDIDLLLPWSYRQPNLKAVF